MPVPGGTIYAKELSERTNPGESMTFDFSGDPIKRSPLGISILSGKKAKKAKYKACRPSRSRRNAPKDGWEDFIQER